ncbi:hypothetical protein N8152_00065 [bacterium]|nr:hypothetical protein [bacterium]
MEREARVLMETLCARVAVGSASRAPRTVALRFAVRASPLFDGGNVDGNFGKNRGCCADVETRFEDALEDGARREWRATTCASFGTHLLGAAMRAPRATRMANMITRLGAIERAGKDGHAGPRNAV